MSANTNALGISPGGSASASFSTLYTPMLGRIYTINGARWMVVKATGALTTMGRAIVASATSGGLPTYSVSTTTTANDPYVIGVCHSSQVDLAAGDFFLVQGSGFAEIISAAAIAASVAIGSSTTAKKGDDASITGGGIGTSLESAAGADENVAVKLTIF
jgi:hypothetical protein